MTPSVPGAERSLIRHLPAIVRAAGFLLGMLVTALLAMGLYINMNFDEEDTADTLIDHAQAEWQRTLLLEHGLRLSLLPLPHLIAGAGSLSESGRADVFASWNEVRLDLDLFALLHNELVIRGARFDGLRLRASRNAAGEWNFASLTAPDADAAFQLKLEGLEVHHGVFMVEGVANAQAFQLRDAEFGCDAIGIRRGGRLQLTAQLAAPAQELEARVALTGHYRFDKALDQGALSGLQLTASGTLEGDRLEGVARLDEFAWQAAARRFGQLGANLTLVQGARHRSVDFDAHGGQRTAQSAGWALAVAEASYSDKGSDQSVEAHARLRDLKPLTAEASQANLEATLHAAVANRAASLDVKSILHIDDGAWSLTQLAGQLHLTHPLLRQEAVVSVAGDAELKRADGQAQRQLHAQLTASTGTDSTQLDLAWDAGDSRDAADSTAPSLSIRADSPHFDLDALLMPAAFSVVSLQDLRKTFEGWDVDAIVHARQLRARGLLFDTVDLPIQISDGQLQSSQHSFELYGGRLEGSFDYDDATRHLHCEEALRDVRLADLLRAAESHLPAEGQANATLELDSTVDAQGQILPAAKGTLRVYAKDARWRGVDLAAAMLGNKNATGAAQVTAFDELSAAFSVQGPLLMVDRLAARSAALSMQGSGKLSLADATQDLALDLRPGNDKRMSAIRGKTVSLHLAGSWSSPLILSAPGAAQGSSAAAQ